MSGRSTAEIAADLRRGSPHSIVAHEAADRLVELEALRLPCPTCGGTGTVTELVVTDPEAHGPTALPRPCPDCTDGRMSHEQAWKIADFALADYAASLLIDHLRGMR